MKALIICADDYAQSASIDAGILSLIEQGRITAASCLSMSPRWRAAAQLIKPEHRQKADLGLHLDFTQFGSYRYSLPMLMARSACRSLSLKKIQLSIHHQLDQFEQQLNTPPDYIDGHQHVHQMPQIRDSLLKILIQRYTSNLPYIRIAKPPQNMGLKARVIAALGADQLATQAKRAGISTTSQLLGIYAFDKSATQYLAAIDKWLADAQNVSGENAPCVSALMCHPALSMDTDEAINLHDPIYQARLQEYAALSSESFSNITRDNGFIPVRGKAIFSDLPLKSFGE